MNKLDRLKELSGDYKTKTEELRVAFHESLTELFDMMGVMGKTQVRVYTSNHFLHGCVANHVDFFYSSETLGQDYSYAFFTCGENTIDYKNILNGGLHHLVIYSKLPKLMSDLDRVKEILLAEAAEVNKCIIPQ